MCAKSTPYPVYFTKRFVYNLWRSFLSSLSSITSKLESFSFPCRLLEHLADIGRVLLWDNLKKQGGALCCPVHWTLFANLAHPIEDYHLELYNTSFPGPIDRKLYHLAPPPTNRNLYFPTKSQLFPEGQVELALIQGKILRRVSFSFVSEYFLR